MEIVYTPAAQQDLLFWKKSGNKAVQSKITDLLRSIASTPFEGPGKPEALKYQLAGKWSRRINQEHRLVYSVDEQTITVFSVVGHYQKKRK